MSGASTTPLASGPPRCPQCGKPMAPGSLHGEAVRIGPANVVWVSKSSGNVFDLTDAGGFAWSASPELPGFVCADCGIVQVRFNPKRNAQ